MWKLHNIKQAKRSMKKKPKFTNRWSRNNFLRQGIPPQNYMDWEESFPSISITLWNRNFLIMSMCRTNIRSTENISQVLGHTICNLWNYIRSEHNSWLLIKIRFNFLIVHHNLTPKKNKTFFVYLFWTHSRRCKSDKYFVFQTLEVKLIMGLICIKNDFNINLEDMQTILKIDCDTWQALL